MRRGISSVGIQSALNDAQPVNSANGGRIHAGERQHIDAPAPAMSSKSMTIFFITASKTNGERFPGTARRLYIPFEAG